MRGFLYTNHEKNYMQSSELLPLALGCLLCFNPSNIAIYLPLLIISIGVIQYQNIKEAQK